MGAHEHLAAASRLSVPEHVLTRRVEGETVLLNLDNEEYYGLDDVGTRLWELIEKGTTFAEAVDAMLGEYDVERGVLERDLTALTVDLQKNGLLLLDAA
jgi:hypothetical protein